MIFFTEMFIEKSSTFYKIFVQIVEFGWLPGAQKMFIFAKMLKNLLLRNHKVDEAVSLAYILLKDFSLYISCVFYTGRLRTLIAMTTYSSHRLGKKGN